MPPREVMPAPPLDPPPLVSWGIVEESLDEGEFLWRRRRQALDAHDQTPETVEATIEERLLGAIDGLCVPGARAVDRVLAPALDAGDADVVSLAAHAALVGGTAEGQAGFAAAFLGGSGARLEALRRGLELVRTATPYRDLVSATREAPDVVRAAFLEACSFRGLPLEPGLDHLLAGSSSHLQRAAARLMRHAPRAVREAWMPRALAADDLRVREIATESGLIAGLPAAWDACRESAAAEINGSAQMLAAVAILGAPRDHDLVLRALARSERQPAAIWALGFGGRRSGADACVDLLAQDRHLRLAAEALCAITGVDLHAGGLAAPSSGADQDQRDATPAFEDDDLDADLVPRAEDRLPVPDVPAVIRWWNGNRARFQPDTRYLAGRPASVQRVVDALANGPMRRRHLAAFELAARTRGGLQIETRAFIGEQRDRLSAFIAAPIDAVEGPAFQGAWRPGRR
jgi:uncharacterized protein (TIGR02270 family)